MPPFPSFFPLLHLTFWRIRGEKNQTLCTLISLFFLTDLLEPTTYLTVNKSQCYLSLISFQQGQSISILFDKCVYTISEIKILSSSNISLFMFILHFYRKFIVCILDKIFNWSRRLFQKFTIHSGPHKARNDAFLEVNCSSNGFLQKDFSTKLKIPQKCPA